MSKLVGWLLSFAPKAPEALPEQRPTVLVSGPVPQWTEDHKKAWLTFLVSPTGAVLMARMGHAANVNAINGAQDMMHTTHSAGRSAGFYEALQWLYSQARIEFEQNIEISGASADQDATSAQQPSGEAALREHYSP